MERATEPLLPDGATLGATTRLDVRARADQIVVARRSIADFLGGHAVPSSIVDDFELVVSELVTNAILYGSGPSVRVEAAASDEVVVAVAGRSVLGAIPSMDHWVLPGADARRGRGLAIVRRLCDDVEVRSHGGVAAVVCRRRLPDGGGA